MESHAPTTSPALCGCCQSLQATPPTASTPYSCQSVQATPHNQSHPIKLLSIITSHTPSFNPAQLSIIPKPRPHACCHSFPSHAPKRFTVVNHSQSPPHTPAINHSQATPPPSVSPFTAAVTHSQATPTNRFTSAVNHSKPRPHHHPSPFTAAVNHSQAPPALTHKPRPPLKPRPPSARRRLLPVPSHGSSSAAARRGRGFARSPTWRRCRGCPGRVPEPLRGSRRLSGGSRGSASP